MPAHLAARALRWRGATPDETASEVAVGVDAVRSRHGSSAEASGPEPPGLGAEQGTGLGLQSFPSPLGARWQRRSPGRRVST